MIALRNNRPTGAAHCRREATLLCDYLLESWHFHQRGAKAIGQAACACTANLRGTNAARYLSFVINRNFIYDQYIIEIYNDNVIKHLHRQYNIIKEWMVLYLIEFYIKHLFAFIDSNETHYSIDWPEIVISLIKYKGMEYSTAGQYRRCCENDCLRFTFVIKS